MQRFRAVNRAKPCLTGSTGTGILGFAVRAPPCGDSLDPPSLDLAQPHPGRPLCPGFGPCRRRVVPLPWQARYGPTHGFDPAHSTSQPTGGGRWGRQHHEFKAFDQLQSRRHYRKRRLFRVGARHLGFFGPVRCCAGQREYFLRLDMPGESDIRRLYVVPE